MTYFNGTLLSSPIVRGSSGDTYGTHYSVLGVGGYLEVETTADRDILPVDSVKGLDYDGLSTGQRRLGMLVKVLSEDKTYELKIPYSTWSGLTETQKVSGLTDNGNWVEANLGGSGTGERIEKQFNQTTHGFSKGDVLGWNNTTSEFEKPLAISGETLEPLGIISNIVDVNNFTITFAGYVDDLSSITDYTGNTLTGQTVYYLSPFVAGKLTSEQPLVVGQISKPMLTTLTNTTGLVFQYRGGIITDVDQPSSSGGTSGYIGPAEDGTVTGYTDGYYDDFNGNTTPVGTPIDRFNRLFKALLPESAPNLSNINSINSFVSGKLSFGPTRNDIGYTNVTSAAGNLGVDINGVYSSSGTRLGIINGIVGGILNSNVVGGASDIPYSDYAFNDGTKGELRLEINGSIINTLDLTTTTGSTGTTVSGTTILVDAIKYIKTDSGGEIKDDSYRTGTYQIDTSIMQNGFNYIRITHTNGSFTRITNYLEWVYDPEPTNISGSNQKLDNLNLTGIQYVSGVEYNTGGDVDYNITGSSIYRNVYSSSVSAISFPSRSNLDTQSSIFISGTGITTGNTTALPELNALSTNPEGTDIDITATLPINSNVILGNVGTIGKLESNINILHPLTTKSFTGGVANLTGFLIYNITQSIDDENEDFTGEVNRLETRDYSSLSYTNINNGSYDWDNTQSLIGGSAQHNTGLLVFNGELMYPNTSYLTTQYGITTGNFNNVTNSPSGNVDYTTASGTRSYNRLFKSNNTTTQSTLTMEITHTGDENDFLTDGGTGGSPSGDNIKIEFVIKRSGGATHGWANPFAQTGNPEGIARTSLTHVGSVTTVTCTLATTPRIGDGDILVVRVYAASGWSNIISNIEITNI